MVETLVGSFAPLLLRIALGIIWARSTRWQAAFAGPQGPGWEFEFALLAAALPLVLTGGGVLALDAVVGL